MNILRRVDPALVTLESEAELPSRFGDFRIVAFRSTLDDWETCAIVRGELDGAEDVPVRLHSECFTGDIMGSLRCDCRDQLEAALEYVGQQERGAVVYLRQEGRGIGLVNKIRAYALQDDGLDTVEANLALGFRDDHRTYVEAAQMLQLLGVRSVQLLTNNPRKRSGLEEAGLPVVGRIPLRTPSNPHNIDYLQTKRSKSGHLL